MNRGRHISRGFSLIEVVVSLAIFGMAFVALHQAFVNGLFALSTIDIELSRDHVFRFVRSQVIQEPDLEEFQQGGSIPTLEMGNAEWEATVEPTSVADLFKVELLVTLTPDDSPEPLTRRERLYLLRPTWSDPVERSTLIGEAKDNLENDRFDSDW